MRRSLHCSAVHFMLMPPPGIFTAPMRPSCIASPIVQQISVCHPCVLISISCAPTLSAPSWLQHLVVLGPAGEAGPAVAAVVAAPAAVAVAAAVAKGVGASWT